MKSQQKPELEEDSVTEEMVERYLRDNPQFFETHQELLASLKLPHPVNGQAISLIERQVELLRGQNRSLESKLMDLVQVARENERLSSRLHSLSNGLLEARTISDVLAITQDVVRDLFETDFVVVKLVEDITDDEQISMDIEIEAKLFYDFMEANKPVCGRLTEQQIDYLFVDQAERVKSSAMVPLKAARNLGVLVLGSADPKRFTPNMGHLFLAHLGDLVSSALAVHLE